MCSALWTLLYSNASLIRTTSPGSSSTSRTSTTDRFSIMARPPQACGVGHGQGEAEGRAGAVGGRLEPDAAAVVLDRPCGTSRGRSRSPCRRPSRAGAGRSRRSARLYCGSMPIPLSATVKRQKPSSRSTETRTRGGCVAVELDPVADQVLEDEHEQRPLDEDDRQVARDRDRGAGLLDARGEVRPRHGDELVGVDELGLAAPSARRARTRAGR